MYHVGEVVLMEYQGWLKAFRVVDAQQVSDTEIEYQLTMLDDKAPQWIRPDV